MACGSGTDSDLHSWRERCRFERQFRNQVWHSSKSGSLPAAPTLPFARSRGDPVPGVALMIPRYLPSVQPGSWLRWLFASSRRIDHAKRQLLQALCCPTGYTASVFPRARQALQAYFQHGLPATHRRQIIVSAQICTLVPLLARECGFDVRFVDTDGVLPVPSAAQYAEAINDKVAAVLI